MIKAEGKPSARLMVIADAPDESSLDEGSPLAGHNGKLLWTALERYCGVRQHECFVTYVVPEAPALKSGAPSAGQVRKHWEQLDKALAASHADVMLLIGGVSLARVTGITKGITLMRGYVLRPQECQPVVQKKLVQVGEYKTSRKGKYAKGDPKFAPRRVSSLPVLPPNTRFIIPTIPPRNIQTSGFSLCPAFWADIQRVGRALNGTLDLIDGVPYKTVGLRFEPGATVTWDIEGGFQGAPIECLGVTRGDETWSCAITEDLCGYIQATLLDPTSTVICHNAGYDIPKLAALVGLTIDQILARLEDTMLGAQIVCPDIPKGLEKVASVYLDVTPWKDQMGTDLAAYNAKDAFVTDRVRRRLTVELGSQTGEYEAVIRCMRALWKATQRGIRYDPAAMAEWRKDIAAEVGTLIDQWPYPHISMDSPRALAKLLYVDLKLTPQYSQNGGWSADKMALAELKLLHPEYLPLLELIGRYNKASQELETWAAKDFGERLHPNFLPALKEEPGEGGGQGAITGRIQAREPNIENLPARRRNVIIADPGKRLWYIDWAQAEAWVEAELFHDEKLKGALREDIHAYIGARRRCDRTRAKNFWYGNGRGAGPVKLRKVLVANGVVDATVAECRDFQKFLAMEFPDWSRGRQKATALAKVQRFYDNPFGRRRRWFMPGGPGLPDVIGWLIQSTVGSMFVRIIPEVDALVEILTPYHDAILFQTPATPAGDNAAHAVQEVMKREWPEVGPGFRLGATAACGDRWSELEDVE